MWLRSALHVLIRAPSEKVTRVGTVAVNVAPNPRPPKRSVPITRTWPVPGDCQANIEQKELETKTM